MVSSELEDAIRRILSSFGEDPRTRWGQWIDVSYESGFDLPSFVCGFLWQDSKEKRIELRPTPHVYQEFAKLASVSPWNELFCVATDKSSVTLAKDLSNEDWRRVRAIANEYFGGAVHIPPNGK
jgi:hypothetical protein